MSHFFRRIEEQDSEITLRRTNQVFGVCNSIRIELFIPISKMCSDSH